MDMMAKTCSSNRCKKLGILQIAFFEFVLLMLGLVNFIVKISYMPSGKLIEFCKKAAKEQFIELHCSAVEEMTTRRLSYILIMCIICLEILLSPSILVLGAIKENKNLLRVWIGHKIFQVLHVFLFLSFCFATDTFLFSNQNIILKIVMISGWTISQPLFMIDVWNYIKELKTQEKAQNKILKDQSEKSTKVPTPFAIALGEKKEKQMTTEKGEFFKL